MGLSIRHDKYDRDSSLKKTKNDESFYWMCVVYFSEYIAGEIRIK